MKQILTDLSSCTGHRYAFLTRTQNNLLKQILKYWMQLLYCWLLMCTLYYCCNPSAKMSCMEHPLTPSSPMSASSDSQYQCPEIMYCHDALLILVRNDTEVHVIYDGNKCISLRMATAGDLTFSPNVEQTLSCMRTVLGSFCGQ